MAGNRFNPEKHHDFTIVSDKGNTIGHIRVKPSGILWAPVDAKLWYGVSLRDFAEFMESKGKRQEK